MATHHQPTQTLTDPSPLKPEEPVKEGDGIVGGCSEGVPPWGYLVVLAGPFDGPPPTKDNDPQFAEHTRQAVEFIQAKTAEVWTPAARAKAPRLAARSTVVGYLDFPTE